LPPKGDENKRLRQRTRGSSCGRVEMKGKS